ncbi:MAG: fumarylacetoacetate hydrolase family protein [Bacteroidota bacterium]
MKLIRFGQPGSEKPGLLLEDGRRLDVSAGCTDFDTAFFERGGLEKLAVWFAEHQASCPEIPSDTRWAACVGMPSKIVCVGLNYAAHAREAGMDIPTEPILFFKAPSAVCGPFDPVIIPKDSQKTDWEVELGVVIGKKASYVPEAEAMDYVAGYLVHNDYSERAFQLEQGGQWVKGKSCDSFAPLGPFMASSDEIADPHQLHLWLEVNGERLQDSTTADLVFSIPYLISYISRYMSLLPGDIISTGTPFGVGLGLKPPRYLKAGDTVRLGIEGLGIAEQVAKAWD